MGLKHRVNDINVYLQPLIKELIELWEVGVPTYVTSTGQIVRLLTVLICTIDDFPTLGNLSG